MQIDIVNTKMLIGKSRTEVRTLLGDDAENERNDDTTDCWGYSMGIRPSIGWVAGESYLIIEFRDDLVKNVIGFGNYASKAMRRQQEQIRRGHLEAYHN